MLLWFPSSLFPMWLEVSVLYYFVLLSVILIQFSGSDDREG